MFVLNICAILAAFCFFARDFLCFMRNRLFLYWTLKNCGRGPLSQQTQNSRLASTVDSNDKKSLYPRLCRSEITKYIIIILLYSPSISKKKKKKKNNKQISYLQTERAQARRHRYVPIDKIVNSQPVISSDFRPGRQQYFLIGFNHLRRKYRTIQRRAIGFNKKRLFVSRIVDDYYQLSISIELPDHTELTIGMDRHRIIRLPFVSTEKHKRVHSNYPCISFERNCARRFSTRSNYSEL